jgi:transposase InsO family protein
MPWKATSVTDQRAKFMLDYNVRVRTGLMTMLALCAEHGVSRKTGYKIIARHEEGGWPGLADRSLAPLDGKHWASAETISVVLDVRLDYPDWGARKILSYLHDIEPGQQWPVASVVHEWIKRAGLIVPSHRARRFQHPGRPPVVPIERPNQQWSTDFKGHFRTKDRRYCYPLTVADSFSRYIIACQALSATSLELSWPVFERLFREYGLPDAILSDNGTPFSSNSVKRLSKLSVRWIRLGIEPRLIQPGKPQQNGRLERMHRDLKREACAEPAADCRRQQVLFDKFVDRFNYIRPHEALGQTPPARSYEPSQRQYPKRLPEIEYPSSWQVRRVRSSGDIMWKGQWFFLSEALVGEQIAFEAIDESCSILRFGKLELGYYSARERRLHLDRVRPAPPTPESDKQPAKESSVGSAG